MGLSCAARLCGPRGTVFHSRAVERPEGRGCCRDGAAFILWRIAVGNRLGFVLDLLAPLSFFSRQVSKRLWEPDRSREKEAAVTLIVVS